MNQNKEVSQFSDDLDVLRHILGIHFVPGGISPDFVMFLADEKDHTFIRNIYKLAIYTKGYIKDEKIALELYNRIVADLIMLAVLKRNNEKNPLLGQVLKKVETTVEERKTEGLVGKLFGKKEPKEA